MQALLAEFDQDVASAAADLKTPLANAVESLRRATDWILTNGAQDPATAQANSHHYLMLAGYVFGGTQMARAANVAQAAIDAGNSEPFYRNKLITARFYIEQLLPRALSHAESVLAGAESVLSLPAEEF